MKSEAEIRREIKLMKIILDSAPSWDIEQLHEVETKIRLLLWVVRK